MTSACPVFGIAVISVTPRFSRCFVEADVGLAHGTVWSFSPEMISSGPRSGFFVSTFASVQGLMLAAAAWKSGTPAVRTPQAPERRGIDRHRCGGEAASGDDLGEQPSE